MLMTGARVKTPFSMLLPIAEAAVENRFAAREIIDSSLMRRWALLHRTNRLAESFGSVVL